MKPSGTNTALRSPPARVLVVDDEEDVRNLVAFNLRAAGMEVLQAANGAEAVQMVRDQQPDLVVLDLMLPELDGVAVCELIRSLPATARTPVIMLTAWTSDRARYVGLQAGANEYVTKPFSPRDLIQRVRALLVGRARQPLAGSALRVKRLSIDLERQHVTADERTLELNTDDYRMLTLVVEALLRRLETTVDESPKS